MSDVVEESREWLERYPFLKNNKTGGLLNRAIQEIESVRLEMGARESVRCHGCRKEFNVPSDNGGIYYCSYMCKAMD